MAPSLPCLALGQALWYGEVRCESMRGMCLEKTGPAYDFMSRADRLA